MALLNENEYKWKKMCVFILLNLFSYSVIAWSLNLGFMVVETILAPLYKVSWGADIEVAEELESGEG